MAAGGERFNNVFMTQPEHIQALRNAGKLSFDQVPLVEVDGLNLVQSVPTALYLGQKYGLYPLDDAKAAYVVGHIYTSVIDARGPLIRFPFHGDKDKVLAEVTHEKALFGRYCPKWEAMLAKNSEDNSKENSGGAFFLADKPSIADCAVFEVIDFYEEIFGLDARKKALAPFPKLAALHAAVLELGWVREWVSEERPAVFLPYDEYKAAVNRTLER